MSTIIYLLLQTAWFCGVVNPQPQPEKYVTWGAMAEELRKSGVSGEYHFQGPGYIYVENGKIIFISTKDGALK